MGEQWHYTRVGQQFGPVSAAELKRMASSGHLSPTDMVWKAGMPNWVQAEKLKGLFTGAPAATATPQHQPPVHSQAADMSPPPEPMPILTNNANPLKTPAITLIVAGGFLAFVALFCTVHAFNVTEFQLRTEPPMFKTVYIFFSLVLLALSGIVIFGGIVMLKQTNYGLSVAGAFICIGVGLLAGAIIWLPFVIVPFGMWALIVLLKPETKEIFAKAKSAVR